MTPEAKIAKLEKFKETILEWEESYHNEKHRNTLRTQINQSKSWVKQEIIEAGCFKMMSVGPPPAIGGLMINNLDPFEMMFEPPYGVNLISVILDEIDETIGVLKHLPEIKEKKPIIKTTLQKNYAFIAMSINPDDHELEDILDSIKEAASKCGILAERVDEVQSNERITDRILESIEKAEFVIVDLTHSRPNVFYEAGYAQGLNKTPIYLAKIGTKLEFDLKDYPVIFFKNMKQLKGELEKRLRAIAGQKS